MLLKNEYDLYIFFGLRNGSWIELFLFIESYLHKILNGNTFYLRLMLFECQMIKRFNFSMIYEEYSSCLSLFSNYFVILR